MTANRTGSALAIAAAMALAATAAIGQDCPWDCETPRDGIVDTSDFLALLGQWGRVGTSCDFLGDPGVGTPEFLQVIGFWGVCPPPANDDCTTPQVIPCPPAPVSVFVPFATAPATPSGASSTCIGGETGGDLWYCLTNISGGFKDVTLTTTVGGLAMEVLGRCTCPPAFTIDCTLDAMSGVALRMTPGEVITIRLVNLQAEGGVPPSGNLVIQGVPVIVGACCTAGGQNCTELPLEVCIASGGIYNADGTTCAVDGCAPEGACCLANRTCSVMAESSCGLSGGVYLGDDTPCEAKTCVATGGCCFNDTSCTVTTELACGTAGGNYQGDNTTCAGVTCPVLGACCFNDTTCLDLALIDCATLGGTYVGDGTGCDTVVCPLRGACCLADGSCIDVVPTGCLAAGGVYQGDATDCFLTTCVPSGACCFTDGSCQILTTVQCAIDGGFYEGDATECTKGQCFPGCGSPLSGSCLLANFTPGCDDFACCDAVCSLEPLCCIQGWDVICAFQLAPLFTECLP